MKVLFKETQRFNLFWPAIVLIPLLILFSYRVFIGVSTGFNVSLSHWAEIGFLVLIVLILITVFSAQMETTITEKTVSVKFFPFLVTSKNIHWEEVESAFVREYNPVSEYGGWGIPFLKVSTVRGLGSNRALNVRGNQGLQLLLKDGSRLLIGTQRPEELQKLYEANNQ